MFGRTIETRARVGLGLGEDSGPQSAEPRLGRLRAGLLWYTRSIVERREWSGGQKKESGE